MKFQTMLQKTVKSKSLNTRPQMYTITMNFLEGEAFYIFEYHDKTNGNESIEKYKMVIKGFTTEFFPPKSP